MTDKRGHADTHQHVGADCLGERPLGSLIDPAHLLPARLVGPLAAQEIAAIGGSDTTIYPQDDDPITLRRCMASG